MKKILLIALYDYYSKGVRGLHSFLADNGHDVRSFYFKMSTYTDGPYELEEVNKLIGTIQHLQPEYVGIAVRSPVFPLFVDICRNIRRIFPDIKIIAGGAHATCDPDGCREHADYVVVGDGEYALLDILGNDRSPGVYCLHPFDDLDSLPFPQYGKNTYAIKNPKGEEVKTSVYTTRGCFFNCSFCQESVLRRKPVRKSVKYFKEEINYYKSLFPKTRVFTISDSNFVYDVDWLEEFAREFYGSGTIFWCAGNANLITEDMIKLVKKAGMNAIRIGVQSGSERIRKDIFNRKDTLDQIIKVSRMIERHRMTGHYDFINENPYETSETLSETREFIKKLPANSLTNKFEMRYWPGTPLTERALADGHITDSDIEGNFLRFGQWTYVYQTIYPNKVT